MRAIYLSGDTVYVRAMLASDKEHAAAWFPSPYPVNAPRAEEFLKEKHQKIWDNVSYYAIARTDGDEIVGGVTLWTNMRHGMLRMKSAPWLSDGDAVRAAALRLLVPWLRDEVELISTVVPIPADDEESLLAAGELGMVPGARLREWIARPGRRVDLLWHTALNPASISERSRANA